MDEKIDNIENIEEVGKKSKKETNKGYIKSFVSFIVTLAVVILIKEYIITPVEVNGDSMYPTLKNGDIMILNKVGVKLSSIDRFDIVVIDNGGSLLIKRIIGLPNEEIKVEDNILYIDGKKVEQTFLDEGVSTNDFEYVVPQDCYFVMGDNREISLDSRVLGCFTKDDIKGTANFTFYPFNRLGTKD